MRAAAAVGVKVVVGVAAIPVTRMMGSVIALAAGVPSRVVGGDDELAAALHEEKEKRLARRRRTVSRAFQGIGGPPRR